MVKHLFWEGSLRVQSPGRVIPKTFRIGCLALKNQCWKWKVWWPPFTALWGRVKCSRTNFTLLRIAVIGRTQNLWFLRVVFKKGKINIFSSSLHDCLDPKFCLIQQFILISVKWKLIFSWVRKQFTTVKNLYWGNLHVSTRHKQRRESKPAEVP